MKIDKSPVRPLTFIAGKGQAIVDGRLISTAFNPKKNNQSPDKSIEERPFKRQKVTDELPTLNQKNKNPKKEPSVPSHNFWRQNQQSCQSQSLLLMMLIGIFLAQGEYWINALQQ